MIFTRANCGKHRCKKHRYRVSNCKHFSIFPVTLCKLWGKLCAQFCELTVLSFVQALPLAMVDIPSDRTSAIWVYCRYRQLSLTFWVLAVCQRETGRRVNARSVRLSVSAVHKSRPMPIRPNFRNQLGQLCNSALWTIVTIVLTLVCIYL